MIAVIHPGRGRAGHPPRVRDGRALGRGPVDRDRPGRAPCRALGGAGQRHRRPRARLRRQFRSRQGPCHRRPRPRHPRARRAGRRVRPRLPRRLYRRPADPRPGRPGRESRRTATAAGTPPPRSARSAPPPPARACSGSTREQAAFAVSIATSMAAGFMSQFGTMTKPLHAGLAAKSGIVAAEPRPRRARRRPRHARRPAPA